MVSLCDIFYIVGFDDTLIVNHQFSIVNSNSILL